MGEKKTRILIVDDEEDLCEIIQFNLDGEGYETEIAYSAEAALEKDLKRFDLILLDVMMGEISGFKFAKIIRKKHNLSIPIIFITAKTTENDLLTGFNLGGDDYITKPFSIHELTARVKAVLSRSVSPPPDLKQNLEIKGLKLNFLGRKLFINNKPITLTRKEFEIFNFLLTNKGQVFSREEILKTIWEGRVIVTDRTIDVHITRLRKKMGKYGKHLKNRAGYGYSFDY
ncbi:MAG: response regulator transcription factor [Bacteroidetes bacterium]|nr:response regulator transcription factor [Bacteroidota bacterium]